jgi:hypothetical protein
MRRYMRIIILMMLLSLCSFSESWGEITTGSLAANKAASVKNADSPAPPFCGDFYAPPFGSVSL